MFTLPIALPPLSLSLDHTNPIEAEYATHTLFCPPWRVCDPLGELVEGEHLWMISLLDETDTCTRRKFTSFLSLGVVHFRVPAVILQP